MYALLDGNNFYCACERAFRPALRDRPVVVLSNNDGCAISRSDEAKALGIKMGAPWFMLEKQAEADGVVALSANFVLYGDMSHRMMSIAASLGVQEVYSIDECFLHLGTLRGDMTAQAQELRERVQQWIGIPCCVGIGATKTLAKLANHVAKTAYRKPGIYPAELARVANLARLPSSDMDAILAATPAREVWGIGPRLSAKMTEAGIHTALDVARMDATTARSRWSVMVERTVRELQGQPCITLDDAPPPRQQIAYTRSFGRAVTRLADLSEAVTHFATGAAEKLRSDGSVAGQVQVFVRTSPHRDKPQYAQQVTVPLRKPTADTSAIVHAARAGMAAIYRPGFDFVKAGVMLLDLSPDTTEQLELDLATEPAPAQATPRSRTSLMAAMDEINDKYGRGTLLPAGAGARQNSKRAWGTRQVRLTPQYTTRWADVPAARA